jgi:hypothetical protein
MIDTGRKDDIEININKLPVREYPGKINHYRLK